MKRIKKLSPIRIDEILHKFNYPKAITMEPINHKIYSPLEKYDVQFGNQSKTAMQEIVKTKVMEDTLKESPHKV